VVSANFVRPLHGAAERVPPGEWHRHPSGF
jgi:hypothetical protein